MELAVYFDCTHFWDEAAKPTNLVPLQEGGEGKAGVRVFVGENSALGRRGVLVCAFGGSAFAGALGSREYRPNKVTDVLETKVHLEGGKIE